MCGRLHESALVATSGIDLKFLYGVDMVDGIALRKLGNQYYSQSIYVIKTSVQPNRLQTNASIDRLRHLGRRKQS